MRPAWARRSARRVIKQSDGHLMLACALQVVQHQGELVPKHENPFAARDADEIVEGVGE